MKIYDTAIIWSFEINRTHIFQLNSRSVELARSLSLKKKKKKM